MKEDIAYCSAAGATTITVATWDAHGSVWTGARSLGCATNANTGFPSGTTASGDSPLKRKPTFSDDDQDLVKTDEISE